MTMSRNVYRLTRRVRARPGLHVAVAVLRMLIGFAFIPAGLKKLLGQPFTDVTNHGAFHDFLHAFHNTGGFYRFVGLLQLVIAVLLFSQRAAWIGAAMAIPILTAIFALCVSTGALPTATVVALMLLGSVALVLWELPPMRSRLRGEAGFPSLVNQRLWIVCGVAIVIAYGVLCLMTGGVYRPRKVNPDEPAFYIMLLIALMPLATWIIERRRRVTAAPSKQISTSSLPATTLSVFRPTDPPTLTGYDFFDFGCSSGGTIERVAKLSPSDRGLGIDVAPAKIELAVKKGLHAINFDILELPDSKLVQFVTMSHFLEHLRNIDQARSMIAKSIRVARKFVVIRQPWFDSDSELAELELKFFWSHWVGHSNHMLVSDFVAIVNDELAANSISGFLIAGRAKVVSSGDSTIIPLKTPIDQFDYDEKLHGEKPIMKLGFPAFKEIVVLIDIAGERVKHPVFEKLRPLQVLFSAGSLAQKD